MSGKKIKEEDFVLTRDMCPIKGTNIIGGFNFFCPVPRGIEGIIKRKGKKIERALGIFRFELAWVAEKRKSPFKNILLEDRGKNRLLQQKLLKSFKIEKIKMDANKGLCFVRVGSDKNSGIIRLVSDRIDWYEHLPLCFVRDFFEPEMGLYCDTAEHYWQALIGRELCVKYFNLVQTFKK
ncbi:MAG: hypothetical protein ABH919_02830 [bacterium]